MDILCLMGLFPKEYENEIARNSLTSLQNAANKLQWNIVKGLDSQKDVSVKICNSIYVGPYPQKYKQLMIPSFEFHHAEQKIDQNIGYINLPYVKILSRYIGLRKAIRNWTQDGHSDQKVLLIYALTTPFSQLAAYAKKHFSNIQVCMIVPDLPEYMNVTAMNKNGMYARQKRMESRWIRKSVENVDAFVLLTDAMKKWFGREIKYIVVEGIADTENLLMAEPACKENNITKKMIYAGGIKREYGVADLVQAFCEVNDPEWELDIYGDGADCEYVKKIANGNDKINFKGIVDNKVVFKEEIKADLLVNPRKNQELAAYSFPSKILEYMSSGTPVIAYKLDGVPDEYDSYYYHIENGRFVESLKEVMELSNEERIQKGKKAAEFVTKQKNAKVQCEKIIELLKLND